MADFKLAFADQESEFSVTRQGPAFHVQWNDQAVECRIRYLDGSYFVLELIGADGVKRNIHSAGFSNGDNRQLWVDGRMANYQRVRRRRETTNHEGSLAATIPAIVSQILVTPGDSVSAGEKLVLLESMKMIIPIQAPYAGTVTAVHCREGESVQAGVQLVELNRIDK